MESALPLVFRKPGAEVSAFFPSLPVLTCRDKTQRVVLVFFFHFNPIRIHNFSFTEGNHLLTGGLR